MIRLLPEERKAVAQYIYSICAVSLDESKGYLIEGRLGRLAEDLGCPSYSALVERAKAEPGRAIERRIIDAITTNETLFFRDSSPFELLRHKIVPELVDRSSRSGLPRIRIWSAACSTGQEIYSIAILLKEMLSDAERCGVRLLGTDISDEAVARASRGTYSPTEISRGLSENLRDKYFRQVNGDWKIRDEIRGMASFKRLNLMADFSAIGKFDVIFCRNVAIYFADRDRVSLFQRIERALDAGGYLVVGAMESLTGVCPQFESKRHLRSVYYQVKGSVPGPIAGNREIVRPPALPGVFPRPPAG